MACHGNLLACLVPVDAMREDEDKFLKPDPRVRECLEALPQKKWILTNTRSVISCSWLHDAPCVCVSGGDDAEGVGLLSDAIKGEARQESADLPRFERPLGGGSWS